MKHAFSLLELLLAIAFSGVMAWLLLNYTDFTTINKQNIKSTLQTHIQTISEAILQCKTLSSQYPLQTDGSLAGDTAVAQLECNTTTPYPLDGGEGVFIPPAQNGFDTYSATQSGSAFYFSTAAALGSMQEEVLRDLNGSYSQNQYILSENGGKLELDFYLSL